MDTQEFRDTMALLEMSQGALSRIFILLGDTASPTTVRRRVERWAQGGSNIPGEAAAFLNLLKLHPKIHRQLMRQVAIDPRQAPRPIINDEEALARKRRQEISDNAALARKRRQDRRFPVPEEALEHLGKE